MKSLWDWVFVLVVGTALGIQAIYTGKLATYGIWLFVLMVSVAWVAVRSKNVRRGQIIGLGLWTVALLVYECVVGWRQWVQFSITPDWGSIAIGVALIAAVGWPITWIVSRWASRQR